MSPSRSQVASIHRSAPQSEMAQSAQQPASALEPPPTLATLGDDLLRGILTHVARTEPACSAACALARCAVAARQLGTVAEDAAREEAERRLALLAADAAAHDSSVANDTWADADPSTWSPSGAVLSAVSEMQSLTAPVHAAAASVSWKFALWCGLPRQPLTWRIPGGDSGLAASCTSNLAPLMMPNIIRAGRVFFNTAYLDVPVCEFAKWALSAARNWGLARHPGLLDRQARGFFIAPHLPPP